MIRSLALAAVRNDNLLAGLSRLGAEALDLLHHVHSLNHLAEHHVLPVQPLGLGGADEELGAVGVGSSIGHGEDSRSSVLQTEVLVLELVAVDGLAPGAVAGSEVSSLAHEVGDDAVEGGALVAEALLSGAESTEVLGSLGDHVIPQLHDDLAHGSSISSHVKEDSSGCHCWVLEKILPEDDGELD